MFEQLSSACRLHPKTVRAIFLALPALAACGGAPDVTARDDRAVASTSQALCNANAIDYQAPDVYVLSEIPLGYDPGTAAASLVQNLPQFKNVTSAQLSLMVQGLGNTGCQFIPCPATVWPPPDIVTAISQGWQGLHIANMAIRCDGMTPISGINDPANGPTSWAQAEFEQPFSGLEIISTSFTQTPVGSCVRFDGSWFYRNTGIGNDRANTYYALSGASSDGKGLDNPASGAEVIEDLCCDGTASVQVNATGYAKFRVYVDSSINDMWAQEDFATYMQTGGETLNPPNFALIDNLAAVGLYMSAPVTANPEAVHY